MQGSRRDVAGSDQAPGHAQSRLVRTIQPPAWSGNPTTRKPGTGGPPPAHPRIHGRLHVTRHDPAARIHGRLHASAASGLKPTRVGTHPGDPLR